MSRQTVPQWMRDQLPKQCCNCGATTNLIYHHIIPDTLGGKTILSNIAVVCNECHSLIHYGERGVIKHNDLVKKGIEEAKKRGRVPGKKPADYENVMRLIAEHSTQFNEVGEKTEREIMEMAKVKPVCYSKCKRMLIDAINAPIWPYEWEKPKVVKNRPEYEWVILRGRNKSSDFA